MDPNALVEKPKTSRDDYFRGRGDKRTAHSGPSWIASRKKDRVAGGIGFDSATVTLNKRVIWKMRNMMMFNNFVECIPKCLSVESTARRSAIHPNRGPSANTMRRCKLLKDIVFAHSRYPLAKDIFIVNQIKRRIGISVGVPNFRYLS